MALSVAFRMLAKSQQTQNICITFVQRQPNVFDVGPTLYNCYGIVLCLLGPWLPSSAKRFSEKEGNKSSKYNHISLTP